MHTVDREIEMRDPVVTSEIEYDRSQERASKAFEYTKAEKRAEVEELADRIINGLPTRVRKYWGSSLLTLDDVIDDVITGNDSEHLYPLIKDFLKGNSAPLHDIFRRTTQYMIARALFDDAEELGFYIWKKGE